jgi:hypothetical protein
MHGWVRATGVPLRVTQSTAVTLPCCLRVSMASRILRILERYASLASAGDERHPPPVLVMNSGPVARPARWSSSARTTGRGQARCGRTPGDRRSSNRRKSGGYAGDLP